MYIDGSFTCHYQGLGHDGFFGLKALSFPNTAPSELGGGGQEVRRSSKRAILSPGRKDNSKRFPYAEQRAALMSSCGKCDVLVLSEVLDGKKRSDFISQVSFQIFP